jgi:hypothetical protein
MFGKNTYLKTLESRKRALLAESDVNRIELLKDFDAIKREVHRVKRQLRAAGSIASSAAILTTVAALFRRRQPEREHSETGNHQPKTSWVAAAINGAQAGASLFFKVRSFMRQRR